MRYLITDTNVMRLLFSVRELTAQIAENQKNLSEMDHILKIKEDLEVKVESMEKELSRKDRDMEVCIKF